MLMGPNNKWKWGESNLDGDENQGMKSVDFILEVIQHKWKFWAWTIWWKLYILRKF